MNPIIGVILSDLLLVTKELEIDLAMKEYYADYWTSEEKHEAARLFLITHGIISDDICFNFSCGDSLDGMLDMEFEAELASDIYDTTVFQSISVPGLVVESSRLNMPVLPHEIKLKNETEPRGAFRQDWHKTPGLNCRPEKSWKNHRKDQVRGNILPIREVSCIHGLMA